jgi:hypothetical protein
VVTNATICALLHKTSASFWMRRVKKSK